MKSRTLVLGLSLLVVSITVLACDRESPTAPEPPVAELVTVSAEVGASSLRGGQPKVDVCHYDADADLYFMINIAEPAVEAHLAHGDGFPDSLEFDADCNPIPVVCDNNLGIACPPTGDPQSFIDGLFVQLNGGWANLDPPCPQVARADWDWGDGTVEVFLGNPPGPFPNSHMYDAPGTYLVSVYLFADPDQMQLLDGASCEVMVEGPPG